MAKDTSPLVRIYVVNGHRTSAGAGPGVVELPAEEASAIVARKYGRILGPDEDPADLGRTRRYAAGVSN
jgi:hypothetical protein